MNDPHDNALDDRQILEICRKRHPEMDVVPEDQPETPVGWVKTFTVDRLQQNVTLTVFDPATHDEIKVLVRRFELETILAGLR
jgi:hypothetical protein